MAENVEQFIAELTRSLTNETFVKLTLGNYKGADQHLQKLLVRLIKTRKGIRLFFLYRHDIRDTVKNYDLVAGVRLITGHLGKDFFSGHLFTTENDLQLEVGKKGHARLNIAKPTFKATASLDHDRVKMLQVDPASFYLKALGITTDSGTIRDKQQDKWRQINKFVEILGDLFERSELKDRRQLSIIDVGSGKGYLTFAAYDYFKNQRGIDVDVTGVDTRIELVDLCNAVASAGEFDRLRFVNSSIEEFAADGADILIALHACNTATDDAIFKGIAARAGLIIVAPCCHQEIRPQILPPEIFKDILKHGIMLERMAEMITDGLRSMLLERSGYSTKLFEFISVEHTPKNNMLVGTRRPKNTDPAPFDASRIDEIMAMYGIKEQRLEHLLRSAAMMPGDGNSRGQ